MRVLCGFGQSSNKYLGAKASAKILQLYGINKHFGKKSFQQFCKSIPK
jgi:hypothetical protein